MGGGLHVSAFLTGLAGILGVLVGAMLILFWRKR